MCCLCLDTYLEIDSLLSFGLSWKDQVARGANQLCCDELIVDCTAVAEGVVVLLFVETDSREYIVLPLWPSSWAKKREEERQYKKTAVFKTTTG